MPTAKKAPPQHLWWVRHPECGLAIVEAPNWELATVEAATKCEIIERDRRLNQQARARKFYRSMMPKSRN